MGSSIRAAAAALAVATVLSLAFATQQRLPRDAGSTSGAARISGVVTDRHGPVPGATVTLLSSTWRRTTTMSDAEGRFAFAGLSQDVYTLTASKDEYLEIEYGATRARNRGGTGTGIALATGQQITGLTLRMSRGGVITGTVRGADGLPAVGTRIDLAVPGWPGLWGLSGDPSTDREGRYRIAGLPAGEYHVIANPPKGSVPVLYPGVIDPARATSVRVQEDEQRDHIDFALVLVPPTRMTGVVLDPAGQPAAGVQVGARPLSGSFFQSVTTAGADGRFVFENIVPGHYTIDALAPAESAVARAAGPDSRDLWASGEVDVSGEPVSDVALRLQRVMVFSGRVEFDRTTRSRPDDVTAVRVFLTKPGFHPLEIKVRADGTFEHGVRSALYEVDAQAPSPGWWLRSAMTGDRDLLDLPPDFDPANRDLTNVVLTFTDRRTQLSGRVLNADGTPVHECTVVVFPVDRELWNPYSRRLTSARPATDGRFVLRDLPAGDYFVTTVRDLDSNAWKTPDFLRPLVSASLQVRLRDGETKQQDVRVSR